jgi:hypothetical protein
LLISVTTAVVCFAWFGVELLKNGPWFLREFIVYQIRLFRTQDAGHGGPFFYHWIVLLVGCFPASIFMIKAFFMRSETMNQKRNFYKWMTILFWVVLILFSIVKTKIVHYSSLCYFPLSFLATYAICHLIEERTKWNKWINISLALIGSLLALALIVFPLFMMRKEAWIGMIDDEFAVGNLQAAINWNSTDALGGVVLLLSLIFVLFNYIKHKYKLATCVLFSSVALVVFYTSWKIVPKVEAFSQAAVIRFYEKLENEDAYVQPMFYKSYAHLFYTKKKPVTNPKSYDHEWLRKGDIDKPVYIIVKVNHTKELEAYPDIKKIGEENGFVFYKRSVK